MAEGAGWGAEPGRCSGGESLESMISGGALLTGSVQPPPATSGRQPPAQAAYFGGPYSCQGAVQTGARNCQGACDPCDKGARAVSVVRGPWCQGPAPCRGPVLQMPELTGPQAARGLVLPALPEGPGNRGPWLPAEGPCFLHLGRCSAAHPRAATACIGSFGATTSWLAAAPVGPARRRHRLAGLRRCRRLGRLAAPRRPRSD